MITLKKGFDAIELTKLLSEARSEQRGDTVPLGEDEEVLFVVGPVDLPQRLQHDMIFGIYPDSDQSLY